MTSVITGDIINSRKAGSQELWMGLLKETLAKLGKEPKYWGIFRGDSFQLEVQNVHDVFWKALYLKACIKLVKGLDVRLSIGVGEKNVDANNIAEANGSAFEFSGQQFERLKTEKVNLAIKTHNEEINTLLNTTFKLVSVLTDHWSANSAEIVKISIENPTLSQEKLGALLGLKQNTVSERQKRAYLSELEQFDTMVFRKIMDSLTQI